VAVGKIADGSRENNNNILIHGQEYNTTQFGAFWIDRI